MKDGEVESTSLLLSPHLGALLFRCVRSCPSIDLTEDEKEKDKKKKTCFDREGEKRDLVGCTYWSQHSKKEPLWRDCLAFL